MNNFRDNFERFQDSRMRGQFLGVNQAGYWFKWYNELNLWAIQQISGDLVELINSGEPVNDGAKTVLDHLPVSCYYNYINIVLKQLHNVSLYAVGILIPSLVTKGCNISLLMPKGIYGSVMWMSTEGGIFATKDSAKSIPGSQDQASAALVTLSSAKDIC